MPTYRLSELAQRVSGEVRGEGDPEIDGVAALDQAGTRQLSFLTNPKYRSKARDSEAAAVLLPAGVELPGRSLLVHPEPYLALANLLDLYHPPPPPPRGVHASASVDPEASVAEDVAIGAHAVIEPGAVLESGSIVGPGCVIGPKARLGERSELRANVVLYAGTQVGKRCLIHSGVVLGGDGFGFATSGGTHHKIPQVGRVVIEDDVEIGANTAVDRGALDDTVIGEGSKIDDLVMIAHGVRLGRGALLAAQSGIAGSTRVGDHSMFAGQAGAAGHLTLGDKTIVAAKSAVLADVAEGGMVAGIPAVDHRQWKRAQAAFRRLPELKKEVGDLRRRLADLERRLDEAEDRS
ncbi:MAG: UDP-3-O-(3-hydroxymyristoyl)glucosamine N-acyltransferase [Acidobacteria bacterium]|nr:UDP-3-O-(3-hydroxymyristoyl)glucosamine N-acyltransferase [Acidobacteriota bacterium]NIM64249.1 UDP-3-O-(3-hydroxymyristoyl)glucosamine N-acyltransferase [Acidobacteriota bacterium]NIO59247.1 UDP-3-O-(3-hydroxymyristoyl)glucosamine N-acyltransferase [Acidobacteriota bacterium]NIQ30274.1 UDP-3-O-(3-hydroxymyristoyl)glucosamine N-acyltransferase [Acidobacteriota bacterium]NIQ85202.1 UDP-3-O-(3-hydroxymyristoyl)glucosamine N-acyltransferase [Acidobacteriota bacterium]